MIIWFSGSGNSIFTVRRILRQQGAEVAYSRIISMPDSSGICARVCPNGNITVIDKKTQVGPHCTQCLACVHFCPQQAMEIRHKPTKKEIQYHHPEVKVKDLIR